MLLGVSVKEPAKVSRRAGAGGAGSRRRCLWRYKCDGCRVLGRPRRVGTAGEFGVSLVSISGGHKSSSIFCFLDSALRAAGISVEWRESNVTTDSGKLLGAEALRRGVLVSRSWRTRFRYEAVGRWVRKIFCACACSACVSEERRCEWEKLETSPSADRLRESTSCQSSRKFASRAEVCLDSSA